MPWTASACQHQRSHDVISGQAAVQSQGQLNVERSARWLVLTVSGVTPFFINIQTYFPGSIRPVPRSPGTSQFWSRWKNSASHMREKICVGSLFASNSLGIRYELISYSKAGWVRSHTSHRTVRGALAQGLTGDGMTPGCSLCCCWHCDW